MKIKIHPLFILTLLFCAMFGGLPKTLICLATALLHECGHIFCAAKMGFECEQIKIMPYGASAVCVLDGIKPKEELKLALAGPAVNACICVFLAGLWWFFPETYAYTDSAMNASLAMLAVNLLPAYPLDGGRAAGCILKKLFGKRASFIILKVVAVLCAAALAALFVFSRNPTLLALSAFLVISAIEKPPKATRINFTTRGRLKRGMEIKYALCDESLDFVGALRMLDDKKYLVLRFMYGGKTEEISQDELYSLATSHGMYESVLRCYHLSKKEREKSSLRISPQTTAATHSAPSDTASSTAPESEA